MNVADRGNAQVCAWSGSFHLVSPAGPSSPGGASRVPAGEKPRYKLERVHKFVASLLLDSPRGYALRAQGLRREGGAKVRRCEGAKVRRCDGATVHVRRCRALTVGKLLAPPSAASRLRRGKPPHLATFAPSHLRTLAPSHRRTLLCGVVCQAPRSPADTRAHHSLLGGESPSSDSSHPPPSRHSAPPCVRSRRVVVPPARGPRSRAGASEVSGCVQP